MLRTSDIRDGFINLENLNSVSKETYLKWTRRGLLQKGDIVFTREAPLGEVGLVRHADNYFLGQRLVLYRANPKVCDNLFLLYWFLNPQNKESIKSRGVGATVTHLRVPECEKIEIKAPDIETQHRIGQILSAYDDLIENNQKQIKLLEEVAQRLYKQWFIDLRYPGHETTPIVDGLPKGWRKEKLGEIIEYEIGGGWGEDDIKEKCDQPAFVIRGTDFYGITHGEILNIPFRYHSKTNLDARALCDGDIIFEVSGGSKTEGVAKTVLIKQALLDHLKYPVMCASFCKLIRLKNRKLSQYMYDAFFYLRKSGKTAEYDKRSASSIVNYRWKDFLNEIDVVIPSDLIVNQYNEIVATSYERIMKLSLSIETTKKARDFILPKLMNDELDV